MCRMTSHVLARKQPFGSQFLLKISNFTFQPCGWSEPRACSHAPCRGDWRLHSHRWAWCHLLRVLLQHCPHLLPHHPAHGGGEIKQLYSLSFNQLLDLFRSFSTHSSTWTILLDRRTTSLSSSLAGKLRTHPLETTEDPILPSSAQVTLDGRSKVLTFTCRRKMLMWRIWMFYRPQTIAK